MTFELGLLATIVLGVWTALDAIGSASRRFEQAPVLLLGVSIALWSLGELVVQRASLAEEVLLGRRVLYAGTALLPVAWLWVAADAARARWVRERAWLLALAALPALATYSCLYWDQDVRFVHWTQRPPGRGALFWVHAAAGWSLVALGSGYFVRAALRLRRAEPARLAAILGGALIPLAGNVAHLATGPRLVDPTPLLLGLGALLIRLAAFDSGLTRFLPVARRDVIEQLHAGVLVADLEGTVVDANPAAARMIGAPSALGLTLAEALEAARRDTARAIEVQSFPVEGRFGAVGQCAVLSDRTDARRLERQLVQAQKLEALGVLTAGIAHEVNNPLAFVHANLNALASLGKTLRDPAVEARLPAPLRELAAEAEELVAEVREGVDRIAQLVLSLRSFARDELRAGRRIPVDLRVVVEQACRIAGVGLGAEVLRRTLHAVPRVLGNESELVQIALNLLSNALEASGSRPEIELELGPARGGALLCVRDRGPGIPAEVLPRLFDPFFTTKPPGTGTGAGTGIGLSTSFELARQHGGTLEAYNRSDGGAAFELWLPAAGGAEETEEAAASDPPAAGALAGPAVSSHPRV